MYRSYQRDMEPFRSRWAAGRGTLGRTLRSAAALLRRGGWGVALLTLLLWIVPMVLPTVLVSIAIPGAEQYVGMTYNLLLGGEGGRFTWGEVGASTLITLSSLVTTPLWLYTVALLLLAELRLHRASPIEAIRVVGRDWRRAIWMALLLAFGMRLLGYLPQLLSYVVGLVVSLLTAFFNWIPGLTRAVNIGGTVLLALLQGAVAMVGQCLCFSAWMTLAQGELRGMAAVMEGIRSVRKNIGALGRLYMACFLLYAIGGPVLWLMQMYMGTALHWAIPAVAGPVLEGIALLLAFSGSADVIHGSGGGGGGGGVVQDYIAPRDLSGMKSANLNEDE